MHFFFTILLRQICRKPENKSSAVSTSLISSLSKIFPIVGSKRRPAFIFQHQTSSFFAEYIRSTNASRSFQLFFSCVLYGQCWSHLHPVLDLRRIKLIVILFDTSLYCSFHAFYLWVECEVFIVGTFIKGLKLPVLDHHGRIILVPQYSRRTFSDQYLCTPLNFSESSDR